MQDPPTFMTTTKPLPVLEPGQSETTKRRDFRATLGCPDANGKNLRPAFRLLEQRLHGLFRPVMPRPPRQSNAARSRE
jgi:hypothetical protein